MLSTQNFHWFCENIRREFGSKTKSYMFLIMLFPNHRKQIIKCATQENMWLVIHRLDLWKYSFYVQVASGNWQKGLDNPVLIFWQTTVYSSPNKTYRKMSSLIVLCLTCSLNKGYIVFDRKGKYPSSTPYREEAGYFGVTCFVIFNFMCYHAEGLLYILFPVMWSKCNLQDKSKYKKPFQL